jgi:PAS domain S-box-containing protein
MYGQFLDRFNFQTKINIITLFMVILVVVSGWVAIDRVILPTVEKDFQDRAVKTAQGVLLHVQGISGKHRELLLQAELIPLLDWVSGLVYVELLNKQGKPFHWVGDEKYQSPSDSSLVQEVERGKLFLKRYPHEMIYETVLAESPDSLFGSSLTVRVGVSGNALQRLSSQLFRVLLAVAFSMIAVSFILTRWFSRMITRPVNRLLRMTQQLVEGRLDEVIEKVEAPPPCWKESEESAFDSAIKTPGFCPLLSKEGASSDWGEPGEASGYCAYLSQGDSSAHCEVFNVLPHSKDELTRLLFAFEHMAAQLRIYQVRLKQRYEFEERLLEACPDGIMATDRKGRIILYNKGAENLLGYPASQVLYQWSAHDIYSSKGEAQRIKKALLSDDYGGSGVLMDYITQIISKDGRDIPIRLSTTILHESERDFAIVGYFHDLTELHQYMDTLLETNELLNKANHEMARLNRYHLEMLSFVTHELKSPIANSYMSANALRQEIFGPLGPEQTTMLDAIIRNLNQSIEMIGHYLDLSRIEKDELPIQQQPTQFLSEVIQPVLEGLSSTVEERQADVLVEVPSDLQWTLDPELFRGVFTNLVGNALKYGEKSGKIQILARDLGDHCRMEVWNSGPGISTEDIGKLFQKFQRLEASRRSSARGTGLGLFITKTVVERHGGKIWAESQRGEGVNFILELPK